MNFSLILKRLPLNKCLSYKYSTSLDTNIQVYNSLTKQKETLKLKNNNNLYWYSCGILV